MTAIFISHSSADNAAAGNMKAWLESKGHTLLFLDFDPDAGIQAGSDWEQTLYQKLRQCQAVIALLTPNWLASKWCFAEVTQARAGGKVIFPVKIQDCRVDGVFSDVQQIDLTARPEEGYRRLERGLKDCGLNPLDMFDWNPNRPPYPGLLAFQGEDAAIFFGRGEEILKALETLETLRRQGRDATRFVLLLGASGSGKSSLARAGVIPRLNKQPTAWLPVPPFRPQEDPLEELAVALSTAFNKHGMSRAWDELRTGLHTAATQDPVDGRVLLSLVRDLTMAARQPEATVLLTIDQTEELFGYSPPEAATRFLRLLRAALETTDRRLLTLATMRSDFLAEFQNHPVLQDKAGEYAHHFRYQAVPVDPMPLRNFPQIIEGPARLAGLQLEAGLIEAMVRDTGTRDALPLLAFTLRRLYERYGQDGRLKIGEYEALGGLEGAIREEAQRLLTEAKPSPEDLEALHAAFIPAMVRINTEGGYARRRARLLDIPPRAAPLLRRFVDARLLVTDRDQEGQEIIEVAHEALLRTWPQLTTWLAEDRDKLHLLESLQRAADEWDKGGQRPDLLVHRNGRLQDAVALLANPRFTVPEGSVERAYLDACGAAQHARERARRNRLRTTIGVLVTGLCLLGGVALWAIHERIAAQARALEAQARQLAAQATQSLNKDASLLVRAMLLAVESMRLLPSDEAADVLRAGLSRLARSIAVIDFTNNRTPQGESADGRFQVQLNAAFDDQSDVLRHGGSWQARVLRDGKEIALLKAGSDQNLVCTNQPSWLKVEVEWGAHVARVTNTRTGEFALLVHDGAITGCGMNADASLLITASGDIPRELPPVPIPGDYSLRVWRMPPGIFRLSQDVGTNTNLIATDFSPDGRFVAAAFDGEKYVRVFDVKSGYELKRLPTKEANTTDLAFSADSQLLGSAPVYGDYFHVWSTDQFKEVATLKQYSSEGRIEISSDNQFVITDYGDLTNPTGADIWDLKTQQKIPAFTFEKEEYVTVHFLPDGRRFLKHQREEATEIWDMGSRKPLSTLGEKGMDRVLMSHDGNLLALNDQSDTVVVWSIPENKQVHQLKHQSSDSYAIAFSWDGRYLATSSEDNTIQVWDMKDGLQRNAFSHGETVLAAAFSPDNRWFATATYTYGGREVTAFHTANVVEVWDLKSGHHLASLSHQGLVSEVAFSLDGNYLRMQTHQSEESGIAPAFIWLWQADQLVAEACKSLPRNMTQEEWKIFIPEVPYRNSCEGKA